MVMNTEDSHITKLLAMQDEIREKGELGADAPEFIDKNVSGKPSALIQTPKDGQKSTANLSIQTSKRKRDDPSQTETAGSMKVKADESFVDGAESKTGMMHGNIKGLVLDDNSIPCYALFYDSCTRFLFLWVGHEAPFPEWKQKVGRWYVISRFPKGTEIEGMGASLENVMVLANKKGIFCCSGMHQCSTVAITH